MSPTIRRVRWNSDERAKLALRVQALLNERPGDPFKELLLIAISELPRDRQRKPDGKTMDAVRAAVRALPPLATKPGRVARAVPEAPAAVALVAEPPAPAAPTPSHSEVAHGAPPAGSLSALLTATVVDVVVGVLSNPRVLAACRNLVNGALARPAPAPAAPIERDDTPYGALVVVAGLSPEEARTVEKEFGGVLPVKTWSLDQTREQLEEYTARARVVIGMHEHLSQAVDSSLRRLGDRYISQRGGLAALHKRLAEEALR